VRVQQSRFASIMPAPTKALFGNLQPHLITVFGAPAFFSDSRFVRGLQNAYPEACLLGCSTAGEISTEGVTENDCIVTGVEFAHSRVVQASALLASMEDSFDAGSRIGAQLASPGLRAVIVFAPGVAINGSALVDGIVRRVGPGVPITGGLAGDGGAFARTWTLRSEGASSNEIVAIGLHGDSLDFSHGSFGGWKPFGPARKVTRCEGNVVYEIDHEPALVVYQRYLGIHAKDLPASGLLFPFAIVDAVGNEVGPIRTILGVDREAGTLTLAGTLEEGSYIKLMHADTDRLVGGATTAAEVARKVQPVSGSSLAVLVSCIGRKLVMGKRVGEEVAAVSRVLGKASTLTGFYSYGEISPRAASMACGLHNQTMTISWLGEH